MQTINWMKTEEEFELAHADVGESIEMDGLFSHYIWEGENNFMIASFTHETYESFVAVGSVHFELKSGREYHIKGTVQEKENKRTGFFEKQLRIESIGLLPPKGEYGIIRYLKSLEGIGTSIAFSLYDAYKDDAIEILKKDPEKVAKEISGISMKRAISIQEQLIENQDTSEALSYLLNLNFNMKEVEKMVAEWGDNIIKMIEENPFVLMGTKKGLPGVTFRKADVIAQKLGTDLHAEERLEAGIEYALDLQGNSGHVYTDLSLLSHEAARILSNRNIRIDYEDVESQIRFLVKSRKLIMKGTNVYKRSVYFAEQDLAENIIRLSAPLRWKETHDIDQIIDDYLTENNYELEEMQKEAVRMFTETKGGFEILSGAAGTGKTFTVKIILDILKRLYNRENIEVYIEDLIAPTGKAAKVLQNSTSREAQTIHRFLGSDGNGGFSFNAGNQSQVDVLIVDESSMLDTLLANSLLEAIRTGAKVILMGDVNQLPSIGPGNVLHDIIRSEITNVITLNVPKRQKDGNIIAINGDLIKDGKMPIADNNSSYNLQVNSREQAKSYVIRSIKKLLKPPYNYDINDIQVVTPMKNGMNGTHILNYELQEMLNPGKTSMTTLNRRFKVNDILFELVFKENDRVIHLSNRSDMEWYDKKKEGYVVQQVQGKIITNGEVGVIDRIFEEKQEDSRGRKRKVQVIMVQYGDGYVKYTGSDKQDLDHAYAISVHKSQGSQWKVLIQLLTNEHRMMFENSLIYTAYTRAVERSFVIYEEYAIRETLRIKKIKDRRTTLYDLLS